MIAASLSVYRNDSKSPCCVSLPGVILMLKHLAASDVLETQGQIGKGQQWQDRGRVFWYARQPTDLSSGGSIYKSLPTPSCFMAMSSPPAPSIVPRKRAGPHLTLEITLSLYISTRWDLLSSILKSTKEKPRELEQVKPLKVFEEWCVENRRKLYACTMVYWLPR